DLIRPWLAASQPADASHASLKQQPEAESLAEMERRLIVATLERLGGHRQKAADALGIGVRTLSGKLRMYGYAPREEFGKAA
ncbi:MAG: helix-turn-helix domain-containing protein, partial [Planctomycetota bacterium]